MAFNKIDLDNIKAKILISEELDRKTKVIRKGKDFWCCCPFHNEKTPSCKINDEQGSYSVSYTHLTLPTICSV